MSLPVADAHCDFLYYMLHEGWSIEAPSREQAVALPYLREGNVKLQCFAVWPDVKLKTSCLQQALDTVDAYRTMLDEQPGLTEFTAGYSPDDERTAAVLTIEGGEALNGSKANLRLFHRLGVRSLSLTWNNTNELAAPAMRRRAGGLTSLGRSIVKEMDRIGVALDVAHLSDAGIDEALSIYGRPVIASHSNARAVCDHPRSLTDDRIERIAKGGGVVCVNFYPPQLTLEHAATIDDVVAHILHMVKVAGAGAVGLGSDFDGMTAYPKGICRSSDMQRLTKKLMLAGLSESDVSRIAYTNLSDYYKKFL